MTYDDAQNEVRRYEALLDEAKRVLAEIRKRDPRFAVGHTYRADAARKSAKDLMEDAQNYSKWLAQKCLGSGPGAAADSGEAKIVVLLDELCQRLKERL